MPGKRLAASAFSALLLSLRLCRASGGRPRGLGALEPLVPAATSTDPPPPPPFPEGSKDALVGLVPPGLPPFDELVAWQVAGVCSRRLGSEAPTPPTGAAAAARLWVALPLSDRDGFYYWQIRTNDVAWAPPLATLPLVAVPDSFDAFYFWDPVHDHVSWCPPQWPESEEASKANALYAELVEPAIYAHGSSLRAFHGLSESLAKKPDSWEEAALLRVADFMRTSVERWFVASLKLEAVEVLTKVVSHPAASVSVLDKALGALAHFLPSNRTRVAFEEIGETDEHIEPPLDTYSQFSKGALEALRRINSAVAARDRSEGVDLREKVASRSFLLMPHGDEARSRGAEVDGSMCTQTLGVLSGAPVGVVDKAVGLPSDVWVHIQSFLHAHDASLAKAYQRVVDICADVAAHDPRAAQALSQAACRAAHSEIAASAAEAFSRAAAYGERPTSASLAALARCLDSRRGGVLLRTQLRIAAGLSTGVAAQLRAMDSDARLAARKGVEGLCMVAEKIEKDAENIPTLAAELQRLRTQRRDLHELARSAPGPAAPWPMTTDKRGVTAFAALTSKAL